MTFGAAVCCLPLFGPFRRDVQCYLCASNCSMATQHLRVRWGAGGGGQTAKVSDGKTRSNGYRIRTLMNTHCPMFRQDIMEKERKKHAIVALVSIFPYFVWASRFFSTKALNSMMD